jgi:hypothetical protein
MTYLFVGERRSKRAISMGVSWTDGRLAAKTLFAALRAAGVDPACCRFTNLYLDTTPWEVNDHALWMIADDAAAGDTIVALGERVRRALERAGVPFLPMVHPAARRSIRQTDRYQAHVASALRRPRCACGGLLPFQPLPTRADPEGPSTSWTCPRCGQETTTGNPWPAAYFGLVSREQEETDAPVHP